MLDVQTTTVTLSWSAPSTFSLSPILAYEITIKDYKAGSERKIVILDIDQTEIKVANLLPARTYKFSIIAKNKMGPGQAKETPLIETLSGSVTLCEYILSFILFSQSSKVSINYPGSSKQE